MRVFHCAHCDHLVFFDSTTCVSCQRPLAFLPDIGAVGSLDDSPDGTWRSPAAGASPEGYRLCRNYVEQQVCNWAIPAGETADLCRSCRLTHVIPDVSQPHAHGAWGRLEAAKRRLVFTLLSLRLPLANRHDDPPGGLAFEFKADFAASGEPVLTGHSAGVITINIAEADDAERERRRQALDEPYRTPLGHLRHESGHYYWDRLIRDRPVLARCREVFGDEREDYDAALTRHYETGPPADWRSRFVTAYASSHPWEDWAETWAHYLHMVDTLEAAATCGVSLTPARPGEPALVTPPPAVGSGEVTFDRLIDDWFPLTYAINSLTRGLGHGDAYPFVLSRLAIEKLRIVHDVVAANRV